MKNSIKITKYIREILVENEDIYRFVGDRIYSVDAKMGTNFPFIVINRETVYPEYTKDGNSTDTITVNIAVADPIYDKAVDIAEYIRVALEQKRYYNDEIKFKDIKLVNVNESIQFDAIVQQLTFEIKI